MIPNLKHRALTEKGVAASGTFGISQKDEGHVMGILRDQLYSDKILAILREYGSNAWDAHRDAGKPDLPIEITLPTTMEPTLVIRDHGLGLSPTDVFEIYTQYGASTKRDSDETIGTLGIGSKAGFAYSDSFTVTSWHGGMKRTYVAVLDTTDKGVINMLHEEPCGEETGVEIQIAARESDITEFYMTAQKLFRHFKPRPIINTELAALDDTETVLTNGYVHSRDHEWIAIMGCVPYRINLQQLRNFENGIQPSLSYLGGAVYFKIGEVHISASREELKYSDLTKKVLLDRLNALLDEYLQGLLKKIEDTAATPWEKRWMCKQLTQLSLNLPALYKPLLDDEVDIHPEPRTFYFSKGYKRKASRTMHLYEGTEIIFRDDSRLLKGFQLTPHLHYVVRRLQGHSLAKVKIEFEQFLTDHQLTGIKVLKTSELKWSWTANYTPHDTTKYKYLAFELLPTKLPRQSGRGSRSRSLAPSTWWEAVTRKQTDEDIFIILHGFRPEGWKLEEHFHEDRQLAEWCDVSMPTVYGYRFLEKKPIEAKDIPGTEYQEWRREFRRKLLDFPEIREQIEHLQWSLLFERLKNWNYRKNLEDRLDKLNLKLGPTHFVTMLFHEGYCHFNEIHNKEAPNTRLAAEQLFKLVSTSELPNAARASREKLHQKYPLFETNYSFIDAIMGDQSELWIDYIKLVDNRQEKP